MILRTIVWEIRVSNLTRTRG